MQYCALLGGGVTIDFGALSSPFALAVKIEGNVWICPFLGTARSSLQDSLVVWYLMIEQDF